MLANKILPCDDFYKDYIEGYVKIKGEADKVDYIMNIICEGYICSQVLTALHKWIHTAKILSEKQKINMVKLASDIEKNIALGGKDDINLLFMFDQIAKILSNK